MLTCYAASIYILAFTDYSSSEYAFCSAYYAAFENPLSHAEELRSNDATKWVEAMNEEIQYFWRTETWRLVPITPAMNLLASKWAFKRETDQEGLITHFRARLVAKGFLQSEGVDYGDIWNDKYIPTWWGNELLCGILKKLGEPALTNIYPIGLLDFFGKCGQAS